MSYDVVQSAWPDLCLLGGSFSKRGEGVSVSGDVELAAVIEAVRVLAAQRAGWVSS